MNRLLKFLVCSGDSGVSSKSDSHETRFLESKERMKMSNHGKMLRLQECDSSSKRKYLKGRVFYEGKKEVLA